MKEKFKKRKLVIPIFIILVMSLSIFSFSLSFLEGNTGERMVKYKGKTFNFINGVWVTSLNGNEIFVVNDPTLLNDIDLGGFNLKAFSKVYLSSDPQYGLNTILNSLKGVNTILGVNFVNSCFEDSDVCKDLPIKKCGDDTINLGVIEIHINEENKVEKKNNCLKIDGNTEFLGKVIDKIILDTLI